MIQKIITVLFTIVIFIVILYLAYITTKLLGKRFSIGSNKNIKIIDSIRIGQDNTLMVLKVAGKTMLVGSSKSGFNYMCELDESQLILPDESGKQAEPLEFSALIKKAAEELKNKHSSGENKK